MIRSKRNIEINKVTNKKPLIPDEAFDSAQEIIDQIVDKLVKQETPLRVSNYTSGAKFVDEYCRIAYFLSKGGYTNEQMADFFGIHTSTFVKWMNGKPTFAECVNDGRILFNLEVVDTLGRRALGYDYVEKKISQHLTRAGKVRTLTEVHHKHMPPDITAIIFWLKNRDKDRWADVNRTEISAHLQMSVYNKIDLSVFDETELGVIKKFAIQKLKGIHGISDN